MAEAESGAYDYAKRVDGFQAALLSILKVEKVTISTEKPLEEDGAAAISQAFKQHVPAFDFDKMAKDPSSRVQVEQAMSLLALDIVAQAAAAKQPVMSYRVAGASSPSIPHLLNLAKTLGTIGFAEKHTFLVVLGEVMEASPIDQAATTFAYVEQSMPYMEAHFKNKMEGSAPPKQALLKLCNQTLKRLSRSVDVLLAGRIHLLLSRLLPSTDRSAVNPQGNANASHSIQVEEVPEGALDTEGKPVNRELYQQFWSLQRIFQDPMLAIDPNQWLQVHGNIKAVLAEFGKVTPTVAAGTINSAGAAEGVGADQGQGVGTGPQTYGEEELTVKYLSSPKLLSLEVRDAGFRRHFLGQCLILLQACSRRSVARHDTFKIKQQGEADDLQQVVHKELQRTPHGGSQFSRAMRSALLSEDHWADWKLAGAQSFERPEAQLLQPGQPPAKKRRVSRTTNMGTRNLSKLWNIAPNNLWATKKENFKAPPTLREFLDPVIQEMDPEQGIEETYKKKKEPVYQWEALRQISKVSKDTLHTLTRGVKDTGNLENGARLLFPEDIPAGAAPGKLDTGTPLEVSGLPGVLAGVTEVADAESTPQADKVEEGARPATGDPAPKGDQDMKEATPEAATATAEVPNGEAGSGDVEMADADAQPEPSAQDLAGGPEEDPAALITALAGSGKASASPTEDKPVAPEGAADPGSTEDPAATAPKDEPAVIK